MTRQTYYALEINDAELNALGTIWFLAHLYLEGPLEHLMPDPESLRGQVELIRGVLSRAAPVGVKGGVE